MSQGNDGDKLRRRAIRGDNAEKQLQLNLAKEPIYMRISTYRSAQPDLYDQVQSGGYNFFRFYIKTEDGKWICWLSEQQRKNGAQLPNDGVCYLYNYSDFGTTALPMAHNLTVIEQNIKFTVAHVMLNKF